MTSKAVKAILASIQELWASYERCTECGRALGPGEAGFLADGRTRIVCVECRELMDAAPDDWERRFSSLTRLIDRFCNQSLDTFELQRRRLLVELEQKRECGIRRVAILCERGACRACRENRKKHLTGRRTMTIEDAILYQPIPCKACTRRVELFDETKGVDCQCSYESWFRGEPE